MPAPLVTEPVAVFLTIMAVILITPLLSERARLPGIVGVILGGILVGPHGLRLLSTERPIELLSTVGLIYLMFNAGLEIDLHQFNRLRKKSLLFGFFTFIIPELSGVGLGRLIGLDWQASVLLGSIYASHTLVAFPIISHLGIARNEAVSVTIGATVITDKGIVRAAIENEATLIVMGWRGKPTFKESIFGTVLDEVVWQAPIPVLVGRLTMPINAMRRVVLVAPPNSLNRELARKTIDVVIAIAKAISDHRHHHWLSLPLPLQPGPHPRTTGRSRRGFPDRYSLLMRR